MSGELNDPTLSGLLRERAVSDPAGTAINVDGRRTLLYADWDRLANRAAHGLLTRGVRRGQRIALRYGGMDWIDYAVAYQAVQRAGATAMHLDDLLSEHELVRRLTECRASGLIHGEGLEPPGSFYGWRTTLAGLDSGDESPTGVCPGPHDVADILYTSGTTGPASALVVTHANLMALRERPKVVDEINKSDYLLGPMPLGTTTSQGVIGLALLAPATLMVTAPGDPESVAQLVAGHRVGSVMITPAMAIQLLSAGVHRRYDLTCVHTLATSSAPFPPTVATALLNAMPNAKLVMAYASVQGVPAVIRHVFDQAKPMSLGRPAPGTEVRITGPDCGPVKPGDLGEIWVRARGQRRMYLDPELDRQRFAAGWISMGDVGYLGDDGDYYLFDRAEDVVRVGSELVSTIMVEAALHEHKAVREAAAIGVRDRQQGEAVVGILALNKPDALHDVRSFVNDRLSPPRLPVSLLTVDALPRNPLGKILKRDLRRAVGDLGGSADGRIPEDGPLRQRDDHR
jgi:fatty-acyl-CoA synthase